jgi:hypothetical protein
MTDTFRAELQRLVEAYDEHGGKWPDHHEQALFQAVKNARAALNLPEPVAPVDGEAAELQRWGVDHGAQPGRPLLCPMEDGYWTPWHIANALLQRQHPSRCR